MQLCFLGAPGAGKGTQCKRLAEHLDIVHLSSGDLLRQAVESGTAAGLAASSYMNRGVLVPDEILIDMFRGKLTSSDCRGGFILDGFPRNVAQAKSLNQLLEEIDRTLSAVIDLQVDETLLLERITGRRVCPDKSCAQVFHIRFAPPRKDICLLYTSPSQRD